jgi:hypothetical protein
MADKKCPRCGLWSSESAWRCDCGYDFGSAATEEHSTAQSSNANWGLVFFILAILVLVYLLVSPLIRARVDASKLAHSGIRTEGAVFDPGTTTVLSYGLVDLHKLSYRFASTDPGSGRMTTYAGSQFVSQRSFERLNAGNQVTIVYLPRDPTISRLAGRDTDDSDLSDVPLVSVLCGIPFFLGIAAGWTWLKAKNGMMYLPALRPS